MDKLRWAFEIDLVVGEHTASAGRLDVQETDAAGAARRAIELAKGFADNLHCTMGSLASVGGGPARAHRQIATFAIKDGARTVARLIWFAL